jgi:hypothetical protein
MGGIKADLIEGRQIEHGAPFALGRIPISPAQAAADQAGGASSLNQRLDLLKGAGLTQLGCGGGGAAPAGEALLGARGE